MDSVYFVCLGARADIKDDFWGQTPLQVAQEELGGKSDPAEKQRYEKVLYMKAHIPSHTLILPMTADKNLLNSYC